MCIGGVREGDALRLERAVGDGMVISEDVDDWELDFDTDGHIEGRVCRRSLRPRIDAPVLFWTESVTSVNEDTGVSVASVTSGARMGEGGRGIETGNARDRLILKLERDEEDEYDDVMLVPAIA